MSLPGLNHAPVGSATTRSRTDSVNTVRARQAPRFLNSLTSAPVSIRLQAASTGLIDKGVGLSPGQSAMTHSNWLCNLSPGCGGLNAAEIARHDQNRAIQPAGAKLGSRDLPDN